MNEGERKRERERERERGRKTDGGAEGLEKESEREMKVRGIKKISTEKKMG